MERLLNSIVLFILFAFTLSCTNNKIFEKSLGKQESKALDVWVEEFEEFLSMNYSGQTPGDNYRNFLSGVSSGEFQNYSPHLSSHEKEKLKRLINESGLWDQIWCIDTIGDDPEEGFRIIRQLESMKIIDDTLLVRKKFKQFGSYLNAIKSEERIDSLFVSYIFSKEVSGLINPIIMAKTLLNNDADFEDYLIKRIITVEFGNVIFDEGEYINSIYKFREK
ncbi:MAG: hypothetical protein HQ541_21315 [Mariniphaga sp.]|nr:hypothetical protein [Mariniphaga sp.]